MLPPDTLIVRLASTQHGLVTRVQLQRAGLDDSAIRRRVGRRMIERLRRGVYRVLPAPDPWLQRVMAAVLATDPDPTVPPEVVGLADALGLAPGAFRPHPPASPRRGRPRWHPGEPVAPWGDDPPAVLVTHGAAARVNALEALANDEVELIVPHGRSRVAGARVHQIDDLDPVDVARHGPLLVTEPARTIVDPASHTSTARIRTAIESAHSRKLTTVVQVGQVAQRLARPGKGMAALFAVLQGLQESGVSMSELEASLLDVLLAAGLPMPVKQIPIPGRQAVKGCADFGYVEARLIVEADGRSWHGRHADMVRDRQRHNDAARAGWQTLRFMWEHLRDDASDVGATVAETRTARMRAERST